MEQGSWVEYHPLTAVRDGGSIEFEISGSGEDYVDFANTVMYVFTYSTVLQTMVPTWPPILRWARRICFCTVCFRKWTFLSTERS